MNHSEVFRRLRSGMILAILLFVFAITSAGASSPASVTTITSLNLAEAVGAGEVHGPAMFDDVRPGYSDTLFDVKFLDDSNIQASGNRLSGLDPADGAALAAISQKFSVVAVTPVFSAPAFELDVMRERGERMSGEVLPDLSTWMRYEIASGDDAEAFMSAMRALDTVFSVEPAALPSPPPAVTPDFTGNQGYLTPANVGIDATYSWSFTGGDGAGITIFDVEYDWNQTHEDLSKINGIPLLVNPGDSNNSPFSDDHGTAVVGEVAGDDNGIGVTGISKGASIGLAPTVTTNLGFNPANAINLAAAAAVPGDVILIEQQADVCGLPSGSYGPQEWINTVYAAIQTATANGIIVVEAAGNGNVNLDQAACGTTFNRSVRDSGAIIVGAGGTGGSNLQRLGFSSYGSRLDLQGWGENVMTTGYGGFYTNPDDASNPNYFYTSTFNGTSSASPIVTGAAANVQGIAKNQGAVLTPSAVRTLLVNTGTAQLPNETQKIGPRPNLAQAIPQILVPEIDVSPTLFEFELPLGAADADTMDIANTGGGTLNWYRNVYTGGTTVVDDWNLQYDYGCNGSRGSATITFTVGNAFSDNFGGSGTWSQVNNEVTWTYLIGGNAVYSGYIAGDHMAGTMTATANSGCWETDRVPSPIIPPAPSVGLAPGGENLANDGALPAQPPVTLVERVNLADTSSHISANQFTIGENDLMTGSQAVDKPGHEPHPEPAPAAGGTILWDLTHGVLLSYEPVGWYSDLVTQLNGRGYTVDTTTAGVDNVSLSNYDVLMVNLGSSWDSAYSVSEVTAIENFVNAGGGLIIMCDSAAVPNSNVNPVAQAFGTTCGISNASDPLTNFANHPITAGISQLDSVITGEISTSSPAVLYGWDPGNKGVLSAADVGGRVVSIGDINIWDNDELPNSDNALFASNVFDWAARSWLTANPSVGATAGSTADVVTIGVNTEAYMAGEYGLLVVHSDDSDEVLTAVPVSLQVTIADFSAAPTSGIRPLLVNFTNLSSLYDTCLWKFGDGATSTNCSNPSHTYTTSGDFTVSLTVTKAGAGAHKETKTDYISVYEPVTANFKGSPTEGVAPFRVFFQNKSSGDFDTCSWTFGDGGSSTSCGNPSHKYTTPGSYDVSLNVSGNGGSTSLTKFNYIIVSKFHKIQLPVIVVP